MDSSTTDASRFISPQGHVLRRRLPIGLRGRLVRAIIIGPLLGLGLAIAGFKGGLDGRSQASVGGGLLIGTGSVYLLEAVNTFNACQGPGDVCGGDPASALPFLGWAVVVLALGLLVEGIQFAHYR
jgi:hypothetical protein